MKSSNIGGQAVMEGIMMRNGENYAVAVRKEDGEIVLKKDQYISFLKNKKMLSLPMIRGTFNFIDSLVLGMKTLSFSASVLMEEDQEVKTEQQQNKKEKQEKKDSFMMGMIMVVSMIFAIGLFMVVPYFLSMFFWKVVDSNLVIGLLEGVIRMSLFFAYICLISRMKDIQRVFMYHGAEHKCINCVEHGMELTVENVMKSSRQHKRCGTSFLLFVMLTSVILFLFIRVDSPVLRVVLRILLVPVIAGVSYEVIRLAGRSENKIVSWISKPGLMMQNLTTREPDETMAEVAIAAVEAVFDWKTYLAENFPNSKEKMKEESS